MSRLVPVGMLIGDPATVSNPSIRFEFHFLDDDDVRLAVYRFVSFDIGGIVTSAPFQDNFGTVVFQSPTDLADVPIREDDAVFMTADEAEATIALPTHPTKLFLAGLLTGEWEVTFNEAMFPFRLDGTWTQI